MKKHYSLGRLPKRFILFLILFLVTGIFSCRDGLKQVIFPKNESSTSSITDYLLQRMDDKNKVHPAEILNWLNSNLPAEDVRALQLDKAQQNVVKGIHVIKIPVTLDGAMFFTKDKGVLQVYSYKWLDKDPGKKLFTGNILAYSYNNRILREIKYNQSQITYAGDYNVPKSTVTSTGSKLTVMEESLADFFRKLWCWMTNGQWVKPDDDSSGSANGEVMKEGCDYTQSGDSGDGADGPDGPGFTGAFGSPGISGADLGANGSAGAGIGEGYIWMTQYKTSNTGCLPSAGEGLNPEFPADGCVYGTYIYYQIQLPNDENVSEDALEVDDSDIDADNNADGNFDNTVYADYVQTQTWPTVTNVLNNAAFVPYNHTNCLTLAKQQIAPLGYAISNYGAAGQTLQVYTEATGVNSDNLKKGITYINTELGSGAPVIVGVDVKPGQSKPPYTDHSTDHFIVIVGSGTDANGKFFRFYDNSTPNPIYGTSVNNKLYYDATTGLIKGSTTTAYDNVTVQNSGIGITNGLHPYIVTQIRKNKK